MKENRRDLTWFLLIALQRLEGLTGKVCDGMAEFFLFFAMFLGCVLLFKLTVLLFVVQLQVAGLQQFAEARNLLFVSFGSLRSKHMITQKCTCQI